jgi:hypothetical protein
MIDISSFGPIKKAPNIIFNRKLADSTIKNIANMDHINNHYTDYHTLTLSLNGCWTTANITAKTNRSINNLIK